MRRLVGTAASLSANVRMATIGVPVAAAEVAKARNVNADSLATLLKPVVVNWTKIDVVSRQRLAALAATAPTKSLFAIEAEVALKPPATPFKNGRALFASTDFKSLEELVRLYEQVLYHARVAKREYDVLELQSFHIKDDLKRGLSAFKQAHLDKEKARLEVISKTMKEKRQFIEVVGVENFSTQTFNDIVNVLRIAGEKNEDARLFAEKVLNDMTLLQVPFDAVTELLLKSVTFGDGPFEDSSLLFSCVEYPERGEISVADKSKALESVADAALTTISSRHQTPLDHGLLIRHNETHPCLQRSPE